MMFAAEGSPIHVNGVVDISFNINGLIIPHTVYVVDNIAEQLILGSDFLSSNQVIVDFSRKIISICSDLVRTPLISKTDNLCVSRLTKTLCIPAGSEIIAHITCAPRFADRDVLLESIPGAQFNKFAVARSVSATDTQSHTVARILNCQPHSLTLPKGTKIATVTNVDFKRDCTPFKLPSPALNNNVPCSASSSQISVDQLEQFAIDFGFTINSDLSRSQRTELLTLLYKYKTCFARSLKEVRQFKNYELELPLKDTTPSFKRQFKLSQADMSECHRQITEMKDCGLIEATTNSKYQSPVFVVNKAGGKKRVVVDLRSANDRIEPFILNLCDMNQLLHSLAAQKGRYYTPLTLHLVFIKYLSTSLVVI